jgi:hypothetical protein
MVLCVMIMPLTPLDIQKQKQKQKQKTYN